MGIFSWEQRKIGDCFTERKESMPKGELLSVTINEGIKRFSELERHDSSNQDKSKYKKVCIGDIAYNSMRMWQGASGFSDYEGIVSPAYTVLKPHDGIDARFVSYLFKTKDLIHVFQINSQGITSDNWNLKFPVLSTINIKIPEKIEEQNKIAEFLAKLDNLITLHQRKYNKLQNLKKYFLEKMFPQNGKRVPEIRFAGFTDDWEQRKFSEIAQRESNMQLSSFDLPSVEYEDVVAEEGILNKNINSKGTQKKGIIFDGNQILYGKLRPYLHNWLNPDFKGIAVGDWWVLKPIETDKNFLYRLIQTPKFDDVANQSSGSKMPRADWNLVANTTFMIPSSITEQKVIGTYFNNIDNLITLHQRKLEKLQNLKKAALDKMFV